MCCKNCFDIKHWADNLASYIGLGFVWLQEKIREKENGEKENKEERKDETNCFLPLYLVEEKSEKKK